METLSATVLAYWVLPGAFAGAFVALLRGRGVMRALVDLVIGGVGGFLGSMAFVRFASYAFARSGDVAMTLGLASSAIGGLVLIWLLRGLLSLGSRP